MLDMKDNKRWWRDTFIDIDSLGKEEMAEEVSATAKKMRLPGQYSKKALASFLRSVGVDVAGKNTRGERVWRIPLLADARHAFETYVGGSLDWDCS